MFNCTIVPSMRQMIIGKLLLYTFALAAAAVIVALLTLPAFAEETAPVYFVTAGQARAYQGPGEQYSLMAIYTQGITLTVTGRSENNAWLQVALSPFNSAWIAASSFISATQITNLPVAATPSGLVTAIPKAETPLTVGLSIVQNEHGPTFRIQVHTSQPRQRITIRFFNPLGKQTWKRGASTDAEGNYTTFHDSWTYTDGVYTVVVTDSQGNTAQASIKFEAYRRATPTPDK